MAGSTVIVGGADAARLRFLAGRGSPKAIAQPAARMERAARRWSRGTGDLAAQQDPWRALRVDVGAGEDEGTRVRVRRVAVDAGGGSCSTIRPRYMTATRSHR